MRARILALPMVGLRGAALFLVSFTLVGLVAQARGRGLDPSLWWIDLRDLPATIRTSLLAAFAVSAGAWAVLPTPSKLRRVATAAVSALFAFLAARDALRFISLSDAGLVHAHVGLPLSLFIALVLAGMALGAWRQGLSDSAGRFREVALIVLAAGVWAFIFPFAQMLFFGTTDYRRPADVAVILGARVYADGQPSPLLADRIETGIGLYRSGLVPILIMSGGDGADGYNEASVMREVALASGVPPAAVLVDPAGASTEATVSDVLVLIADRHELPHPARVIAVSQAYHLPRVQLSFANAGLDVLTVPAAERTPIGEMPLLVAREVPAFWVYFLRVGLG